MKRVSIYTIFCIVLCFTSFYHTSGNNERDEFIESPQTVYLFSHGIADSHRQAFRYLKSNNSKKTYIIPNSLITFDYPSATYSCIRVNRHQVSLAQDHEVVHLANRFYSTIDQSHRAVLIGVSCGASCVFNFMAWYHPSSVAAVVLESPFDSADSIVSHILHRTHISWIPGSQRIGLSLMCSIFKKFKADGIKPIESATEMDHDIPLLLVCTLQDSLVPAWSTMLLYAALKKSGHKHTYLLVLPTGQHAELIDDPINGPLYQNVAHAFYRRYNLPYDEKSADAGQTMLNDCQPTIDELLEWVPDYAKEKFDQWQ